MDNYFTKKRKASSSDINQSPDLNKKAKLLSNETNMSTKREESKPNQNMYVITKFFSTGATNNEIKKKEDEKNNNLMDGYYSNALNKKKNLNSKKDTKNKNTNNSDSEENESNAKSNSKHIKKLPENKSTKSKSASSAKTKNKPLNSISNQPSLQEFDLRQKELKYKQQLNENQKYLEKINEFKEKMTKRSEKDIADELPSLDLGDNDESNESNDKTLNENKSEEEEDDREKFISYFETLKRKQLKSESSDTSSVITVGDSQTSLSSQDSDLYIVDDEDSPIEKAIQFAKSYVVNNAQFDKNNNVSAQIKCIKRDKEMEINIIKTEYVLLKQISYISIVLFVSIYF